MRLNVICVGAAYAHSSDIEIWVIFASILYVAPWDARLTGELWQAAGFPGAELAYAELWRRRTRARSHSSSSPAA